MRFDKAIIFLMYLWAIPFLTILLLLFVIYTFIVPGHLPGKGFESIGLIVKNYANIYLPYFLSILTATLVIKRRDYRTVIEKPFIHIVFIIIGLYQFLIIGFTIHFVFSDTNLQDFINDLTFYFDNLSRNVLNPVFTFFYLYPSIIERK